MLIQQIKRLLDYIVVASFLKNNLPCSSSDVARRGMSGGHYFTLSL